MMLLPNGKTVFQQMEVICKSMQNSREFSNVENIHLYQYYIIYD